MGNIALKIAALIFGILLWFLVISQRDFQLSLEVPLNFVKLSENLAIASKPPRTINITVEGKSWDLIRLRNEFQKNSDKVVSMVVDLQKTELGSTRIPLDSKNFYAPNYPNVHYLEPENHLVFIDLDIDTRISRSVPVNPNVTFTPDRGYLLADVPKVTPEEIQVSGARNTIAKIINVSTANHTYDSLKVSKTYDIPLTFENFPAFVTPSDTLVHIDVNIQKMNSRTFKGIPVSLIGFFDKSQYTLTPEAVSVEITGGVNVLDSISADDIELIMEFNRFSIEDLDSLSPTVKLTLPPTVNRDMSIKAIQLKPDKVCLKKLEVKEDTPAAPTAENNAVTKKKAEEIKK
ncbi:MAG: hypothetical protein MJY87_01870 [Fibrobacter sp.]|nr:hypothetical protein [Fibrobacter sp.]